MCFTSLFIGFSIKTFCPKSNWTKGGQNGQKGMGGMGETITWIDARKDTPDEGIVVLAYIPKSPDVVWPAYVEDGHWIFSTGASVDSEVTHWAEFPCGPAVTVNPAR
jgi:hypothetical protein